MGNTTGRPPSKGPTAFAEELARRGGQESEWATRWRSDPGKLAIAARLRSETTLPIKWFAARVQIRYGQRGQVRAPSSGSEPRPTPSRTNHAPSSKSNLRFDPFPVLSAARVKEKPIVVRSQSHSKSNNPTRLQRMREFNRRPEQTLRSLADSA
jgi:hypothetical protein